MLPALGVLEPSVVLQINREFFAARIRNLNTREAYARACAQFLAWSENHVDDIKAITPMHVAAYIEQHPGSPQTIKQHLAAIKMLFDYLVVSQIVPANPAAPVKGPNPCRQTRQNTGLKR
jgi:integrase/recombinase XerD